MLDDVGVTVKQELAHDWPTGMRVRVITAWAKRYGIIECYDEGYIGVRVQKRGRPRNDGQNSFISWHSYGSLVSYGNKPRLEKTYA